MGNLFKKVRERKHQYHRSKHHTQSPVGRLWGTEPYRRLQVSVWRLGGGGAVVKRMLSSSPACPQEALAREGHLEERCLYEHKELLDPGGDGCSSNFTECGTKIHSLEKNMGGRSPHILSQGSLWTWSPQREPQKAGPRSP